MFDNDITLDDVALAGISVVVRASAICRSVDVSAIALASRAVCTDDDSPTDADGSALKDEVPRCVFLRDLEWDVLQLGLLQRVERVTCGNDGHHRSQKVFLDARLDERIYAANMHWFSKWEVALMAFLIIEILLEHHKDTAFGVRDISETKHPTIRHVLVLLSARLFVSLTSFRIRLVVRRDGRLVVRRHCNVQ